MGASCSDAPFTLELVQKYRGPRSGIKLEHDPGT